MTAGIASRHIYSIASWSPSQSEPRTVSNMCQRQSAERGADAALRGDGVAAGREHLGDAGGIEPRCDHAECRPKSRTAGAEDDDVERVVDDVVAVWHCFSPIGRERV